MSKMDKVKITLKKLYRFLVRELKRTSEIIKRLISASKTNTDLNETYEELGRHFVTALDKGEVICKSEIVINLIEKVKRFENDLASMEDEVNRIKFGTSK